MEKIILLTVSVDEEGMLLYDMAECKSREEAHERGKAQFLEFLQDSNCEEADFNRRYLTQNLFEAKNKNSIAEFNYYIKTFK